MASEKYTLVITDTAFADLDSIYAYIKNQLAAPLAANNQITKIEKAIMRIEKYPFSHSEVIDLCLKEKGYRKLVIDNYLAFYTVDKASKTIHLMRVLYGAQNYKDILY